MSIIAKAMNNIATPHPKNLTPQSTFAFLQITVINPKIKTKNIWIPISITIIKRADLNLSNFLLNQDHNF